MNPPENSDADTNPLVEGDAQVTYSLAMVAELTGLSEKTILIYQEQGLIIPQEGGSPSRPSFDDLTLLALSRMEGLRATHHLNDSALKLVMELLDEIDRLRAHLRMR